jgi:hypothetical protein
MKAGGKQSSREQSILLATCFLGLFNSENGGDMFLQNIS